MTVCNIVVERERVVMITDGAGMNGEGRLHSLVSKPYIFPHINAAITISGERVVGTMMADTINCAGASSFDEAKAKIANACRVAWEQVAPIWDSQFGQGFSLFNAFVAGWSETKGPTAYALCSHSHIPGISAWTVTDLDPLLIYPSAPGLDEKWLAKLKPSDDGLISPLSDADAIELIEHQRGIFEPRRFGFDGNEVCRCGGFVQLTIIDQAGISTRVVHRWPDKIGSKITAHSSTSPQAEWAA